MHRNAITQFIPKRVKKQKRFKQTSPLTFPLMENNNYTLRASSFFRFLPRTAAKIVSKYENNQTNMNKITVIAKVQGKFQIEAKFVLTLNVFAYIIESNMEGETICKKISLLNPSSLSTPCTPSVPSPLFFFEHNQCIKTHDMNQVSF